MPITALPTPPSRQDPANFNDRADAFLGALPQFQVEANELQTNVNASEVSASTSATNALASANAAANTANVSIWVSGTTYAVGVNRFSPINYLTYRRKTAGAGTTDPSLDSTNWQLVSGLGDVRTTTDQTIGGVKTFSNQVIVQGARLTANSDLRNVGFGDSVFRDNTSGYYSTAVGHAAYISNTSGWQNCAFGHYSLSSNTNGSYNSAFGSDSLGYNTSGSYNTAFGSNSLYSNTTGSSNTAVGNESLYTNIIGQQNTAVGNQALQLNTASFNTALGAGALGTLTGSNTNCTGLGVNAQVTGSNQIQLGNSSTTTYVFGTVQNRSDIRDKVDVRPTVLGLDFINALRPVDYKWDLRDDYKPEPPEKLSENATEEDKIRYKKLLEDWSIACKHENLVRDGSKKRNRYHHGLIAQEVKSVIDNLGVDFGGYQDHKLSGGEDVLSIGYDELIAPLIKAVQELTEKVSNLEKQLATK